MSKRIYCTGLLILILVLTKSCSSKNECEDVWIWFSQNQNELYHSENNKGELFDKLQAKLRSIDSNLVFEFSPVDEKGIKEFTISADGLKESFPSVIKLVDKAPKFNKWKISAFRQRIPGDGMAIVYDDTIKVAYADIYFNYFIESNKVNLELNIRDYKVSPSLDNAIYILLDGLIGEYDMETRIGSIERNKLTTNSDSAHQIIELRSIVDSLKKIK